MFATLGVDPLVALRVSRSILCTRTSVRSWLTVDPSVGVWLSLRMLEFGRELDPYRPRRECAPRESLSCAPRCARGRAVEAADAHDRPRARVRRPRRWL